MIVRKVISVMFFGWIIAGSITCKKEKANSSSHTPVFTPKKILYQVKGTHFRLNYIDSNSVFQKDQVFHDSFKYQFTKGPGAGIGISVFLLDSTDRIDSWEIYINGKLYANAFSEGGAYMTVPYD